MFSIGGGSEIFRWFADRLEGRGHHLETEQRGALADKSGERPGGVTGGPFRTKSCGFSLDLLLGF